MSVLQRLVFGRARRCRILPGASTHVGHHRLVGYVPRRDQHIRPCCARFCYHQCLVYPRDEFGSGWRRSHGAVGESRRRPRTRAATLARTHPRIVSWCRWGTPAQATPAAEAGPPLETHARRPCRPRGSGSSPRASVSWGARASHAERARAYPARTSRPRRRAPGTQKHAAPTSDTNCRSRQRP